MKTRMSFTKTVSWSMALLMAIFAVGCDGDHGTVPPPANIPSVTSTVPANGDTGVQINRVITATFSETMDETTISTATFKVTGPFATPIVGVVTYFGQTATFTPASPLTANSLFTATIAMAAENLVGTPMAADYVWSFTTGSTADTTSPTLILTGALTGATNLPVNRNATATFSEPMDPATLASPATNFTLCATTANGALACNPAAPVAGVVTYLGNTATFNPDVNLLPNTWYKAEILVGAEDLAGNALTSGIRPNPWWWQTGNLADVTAPTITLTNPADLAIAVPIDQKVNATFSEEMDPTTMTTANIKVKETVSGNNVTGTVSYDVTNKIATFFPLTSLTEDTDYTVTVSNGAKDISGNALVVPAVGGLPEPNPWTFRTVAAPVVLPVVDLGTIAPFGTFGGSAGMTNTGIQTVVNGDIGTIATATSSITGFHDTAGDIYTETPANIGAVNGLIYTCTISTTGPTSVVPNPVSCAIATQGRLDAETAYIALAAMPVGGASPAPGNNLAGLTLLPGVYSSAAGFMITGADLTLDAQGDANASWVFQMPSSTLVVGDAAVPRNVLLTNGALAKNVFWQVGSAATINPSGGGTMEGTIISSSGVTFSTAGNTTITTLNGRAISLVASVTLVDTIVNVPAP